MSFGDGIAGICASVEERHGAAWAWVTFIGILGGILLTGVLFAFVVNEYVEWDVGRQYPNQTPCSEPHVCDTFHSFVLHDIKHWWNEDVKKL